MSHFTVLVVGDNPDQALAPFKETSEPSQGVELEFQDEEAEFRQKFEDPEGGMPLVVCREIPNLNVVAFRREIQIPFKLLYPTFEQYAAGEGNTSQDTYESGTLTFHEFQETVVYAEERSYRAYRGPHVITMHDLVLRLPWSNKFDRKGGLGARIYPEGSYEIQVPYSRMFLGDFKAYAKEWCESECNSDGRIGYWYNPKAKWDWYQLGGRWSGIIKLKEGAKGLCGAKGVMESCSNDGEGWNPAPMTARGG